jgi:hypothetical protein
VLYKLLNYTIQMAPLHRKRTPLLRLCPALFLLLVGSHQLGAKIKFEEDIRPVLERSCFKCHGGEKVKGEVDFSKINTETDADSRFDLWETVREMIEAGEMPPEDNPQLNPKDKTMILDWHQERLEAPIEPLPGTFRPRRLSGPEYRNTLRSLFGFDLEVAIAEAQQTVTGEQSLVLKLLPKDPPGASGFINDTHGAALSSVIWEQYAFLTDTAIERLFAPKQRTQLEELIEAKLPANWEPSSLTLDQSRTLIRRFVPRALRRLASDDRLRTSLEPLKDKSGPELLKALKFEMKAVLLSPSFLYRGLLMERFPGTQRLVDSFELAERLSYFLWEDRPDDELMTLAADGSILKEEVITAQVKRMLKVPQARNLAESFGVQWLGIANLDELIKNPISHHSLRTQPVLFLNHLFTENRPVIELISSRTTFVNEGVSGFYGQDRGKMKRHKKPKGIERHTTPFNKFTLEKATWRGGIITMPGILTMNRGPIQRGTWLLRRVLGVKLGEPPADVPPIKPAPRGQKLTFRERFERHRTDPSCARCHEKIDPLGFSLDAYDVNGRFINQNGETANGPDTSGKLPTGESFEDYAGLKEILLGPQREKIIRNSVQKTLSYAMCRKLTRNDQPTIDRITKSIVKDNGTWEDLFVEIVNSLPFRETIFEGETK